jgi:pilus assembly protein CpaB
MVLRIAVFFLIALGVSGFAGIAWLATRSPAPVEAPAAPVAVADLPPAPPPPPPAPKVLVASHPLRAGTLLKPDDVTAADANVAPEGAMMDTPAQRGDLAGAMIRHSLSTSQALVQGDVMRPGEHGFLAAVLSTDAVSGSAGLIWPGDHVDLVLTRELDMPGVPLTQRVLSRTILHDRRVVAVDQQMAQGVNPSGPETNVQPTRNITLEVTSQQVETVVVATKLGRLSVVVRSADAPAADPFGLDEAAAKMPTNTYGTDVAPANPNGQWESGSLLKVFQGGGEAKEFRF